MLKLKRGGLLKMACQRSSRRKHTDGVLTDPGKIQGLDITIDGCSGPELEFNSVALRERVYTRVHEALNEHLDDMVTPTSSIAFGINSSRKLSWTKDSKSLTVACAAVITLNVQGRKDGGKPFTDRKNLACSIAEGVTNYVIDKKDAILAQFTPDVNVTEIKVETNIKDKESDKFLTIKINLATGQVTNHCEPGEDIPIDWKRRMEDVIHFCGSCSGDIVSGQSRIICGGCSTDFHWTCIMEEISAETGRSRSRKVAVDQWVCSSCSEPQNGQQPGTGTNKRKRKRAKGH